MTMFNIIKLNEKDNVGVAPMDIPENKEIADNCKTIERIPFGHKVSLKDIEKGNFIFKYGQIIGTASRDIKIGEHVHSHNLVFSEFKRDFELKKNEDIKKDSDQYFFDGFVRSNKQVGTRNYIGLISTVNCSATVVKKIAQRINNFLKNKNYENIDGAVALKHSSGCGTNTSGYGMNLFHRTIEGFKKHPNFGKVYVVGLGCECAQLSMFQNEINKANTQYFNIQDEGGTSEIIEMISNKIIDQLDELNRFKREKVPISNLKVALQCGGSDGYSGVTANPALGYASDLIVKNGGSTILAETPEIYGAEHLLIERAIDREIVEKLQKQISWWQNYTNMNGATLDGNPSPGNKKGGLTTILEKSLGAVAKGGNAVMSDVLDYAETLTKSGFNFMNSPGYDPVSVTGQVASGANIICFTTGRGSCFGFKPSPSIKIATNTNMYNKMTEDMDINAGSIMDGEKNLEETGLEIFNKIIEVASGKKSKSEINGYGDDEFNPWIVGATL